MGRISALTELTTLASDDYLVVLDSSANIAKKITIANAFGIPELGWTTSGESWTYASATTITVPSDATTKYGAGMLVKFTQSTGGTKYATIKSLTSTVLTIEMKSGTLVNEAITSTFYSSNATPLGAGRITPPQWSNPYRFRAYRNAALNSSVAITTVAFDSETFDTNSNFNTSTGEYTAPVTGSYQFNWRMKSITSGIEEIQSLLYVNGVSILAGTRTTANSQHITSQGSDVIPLTAGDVVTIRNAMSVARAFAVGSTELYFSGFLVSEA